MATAGDELRAAQGAYQPDRDAAHPTGTGDRSATFVLQSEVELRGGYAGLGAPDPDARDVATYETILSGDLAGNDGPNFVNTGDNSYHVVTASGANQTAILDGFTIQAGNANGAGHPNDKGAGLLNIGASPTVSNCTVARCQASYNGAGVVNREGSGPSFANCVFRDNLVQNWGGAMTTESGCWARIADCTFQNNTAISGGGAGGALDNYEATVWISGCTFTANHANGSGGAVHVNGSTVATLTNCVFTANSSGYGAGALLVAGSSTAEVVACAFEQNSSRFGGALAVWRDSSLQLINCCLLGNNATGEGGGINVNGSTATFRNCLLAGNSCAGNGGAMAQWNGNSTLLGCTTVDNVSTATVPGGGGLRMDGGGSLTISNVILWNNADAGGSGQAAQIERVSGTVSVNYTCVTGWDGSFGGAGNTGLDPLFVDPDGPDNDPATWQDNDYHLAADSPCIDTADPAYVPPGGEADLDGYPRICGATCRTDMGAYEYEAGASVDCNSNGISDECDIVGGTSLDVFDALPNGYANAATADKFIFCQHAPGYPGFMGVQPIPANACSYVVNHATIVLAAKDCMEVDLDLSIVQGVHVYGFVLDQGELPNLDNMRKELALYHEYCPLVSGDIFDAGLYYGSGRTVFGLDLYFAEMSVDGAVGEQLWFGVTFEPVDGTCPGGDGPIGVPASDVTHASTGYESGILVTHGGNGPVDIVYCDPYTITDGILAMHLSFRTPGDINGDGVVDMDDFLMLAGCLTGPDVSPALGCETAALAGGGDVDLADFAFFQTVFSATAP